MWTRDQRVATFKNPQIVRDGDKLYLAVTADFGRRPSETLVATLYQRIRHVGDVPRKWWYGTKFAADRKFDEREAAIARAREFAKGRES